MLTLVYICSVWFNTKPPWNSKNQEKTKIICHAFGKRWSPFTPEMADVSNQDDSAHSSIVGQPNNLQLIPLTDLLQAVRWAHQSSASQSSG